MDIEPRTNVNRPRGGRYASFFGSGGYFQSSASYTGPFGGLSYSGWGNNATAFLLGQEMPEIFFAMHARQDTGSASESPRITFNGAGGDVIEVRIDVNGGTLNIYRDGSLIVTNQDISSLGLALDTWMWVSGYLRVDGANSALVLRVNDDEIYNAAFTTARAAPDRIALSQVSSFGSPPFYKNLIVHDGHGAAPFDGILANEGYDVRVIRPNATILSGWTSSTGSGQYEVIDDQYADSAADYLYVLDGVGESRVGFETFDPTGRDVLAVQPVLAGYVSPQGAAGTKARMTLHFDSIETGEDFEFTNTSNNLSMDSFAAYVAGLDPALADLEVSLAPVNAEETMAVAQVTVEVLTRAA